MLQSGSSSRLPLMGAFFAFARFIKARSMEEVPLSIQAIDFLSYDKNRQPKPPVLY
jgi:hypothetical protein